MADHGNTYSRLVAFLKVLLPLGALALLSTLFLLSRNIGGEVTASIPFAKLDLEKRAREQQITAPFFSGRTSDGHLISFNAESAQPDLDDPKKSSALKMDARIDLTDGSRLTLSGDVALVDNRTHLATLSGGVMITSSNGYTIRMDKLTTSMRELAAQSSGKVTGYGPGGTFEAGLMTIESSKETDEATILFTNGVKLIYSPAK